MPLPACHVPALRLVGYLETLHWRILSSRLRLYKIKKVIALALDRLASCSSCSQGLGTVCFSLPSCAVHVAWVHPVPFRRSKTAEIVDDSLLGEHGVLRVYSIYALFEHFVSM